MSHDPAARAIEEAQQRIAAKLADLHTQARHIAAARETEPMTDTPATEPPLTTYSELAEILTNLPLLVRERRRGDRLSLRAAAEQAGIGFNSLYRFEKGHDVNGDNLAAILRWLDRQETPDA